MSELKPQPAEFEMTLVITRAATGKQETVKLIGTTAEPEKEQEHGSNPLDRVS